MQRHEITLTVRSDADGCDFNERHSYRREVPDGEDYRTSIHARLSRYSLEEYPEFRYPLLRAEHRSSVQLKGGEWERDSETGEWRIIDTEPTPMAARMATYHAGRTVATKYRGERLHRLERIARAESGNCDPATVRALADRYIDAALASGEAEAKSETEAETAVQPSAKAKGQQG